jgi:uncharacterized membrane protein YeiB
MMKQRIIGFDLARAYAIFGMYIVNFNIVFGSRHDESVLGRFLSLFSGNSSTVFVMLAGMGLALMTNRPEYISEKRTRIRKTVHKRGLFLFAIGLLLYLWWPADILHFYGGYMHFAALLLFVDKRFCLWVAAFSIVIFHLLLLVVPYETGWDFDTLQYKDFWTIEGFLRNTFYNGWNPVFPWLAYFTTGMYLGRLNWSQRRTQKSMFLVGFGMYASVWALQLLVNRFSVSEDLKFYIEADYLPPFLPFLMSTIGFGLMLIVVFVRLGNKVSENPLAKSLANTGRMTLTHYISHLTVGMLLLAFLTDKTYIGQVNIQEPVHPAVVFGFSVLYFAASYGFSRFWSRRFENGPFETLMRKISG